MTNAIDDVAGTPSDAELINAVRRGSTSAYGVLYERHLGAARRAARSLLSTSAEREDLVAEAFSRVLRVLRSGQGPTEAFRPYLFVTMRNTAISAHRRGANVTLCAEVPDAAPRSAGEDPTGQRAQSEVIAHAFASLPERWRLVLWHTEVEGQPPAAVAPLLGLSPNGVAALAHRAREGLRQAYLRQFVPSMTRRGCRAMAGHLVSWVRQGMPPHTMRRVRSHLAWCADCRALTDSLTRLNHELYAALSPLVLGAPFAVGVLPGSLISSGAAPAAIVAVPHLTAIKIVVSGAALAAVTAMTAVATSPVTPADPSVTAPRPGPRKPAPAPPRDHPRTPVTSPAPAPTIPAPSRTGAAGNRTGSDAPAGASNPEAVLGDLPTAILAVPPPTCEPAMPLPCYLIPPTVRTGRNIDPAEHEALPAPADRR